jgi:NADPH:quinone reductase-like Zn-dependent oxidoreductase
MKAAQIEAYGDTSVIKINDIDIPRAQPGHVVVEVYAASLNPFDSKIRSGQMQQIIPLRFPTTLGGDIAGIVTEVGTGVSGIAIGDKVYGQSIAVAGDSGALAEFASTSAHKVAKIPATIDFVQAASLPLAGVSALQGLTEHIKITPGQKLLITGGTGGIGSIATQIAKHMGAYVAATATGEGIERAKQLGADEVIDYKSTNVADVLHNYDAVLDTVGGPMLENALHTLKQNGVAISLAAQVNQQLAEELHVRLYTQQTSMSAAMLNRLRELVEVGAIVPQVDKIFRFDEIIEAFQSLENGGILGKVVVKIKND